MDKFRLFPPQASTTSHEVDALFLGLTLVSLFFVAVVFVPILFFLVKYRKGSRADRSNPRSGSLLMESGWTIGPILISLGLFSWGALVYFRMERPPSNGMEVEVVGKQWMWKLQHAEGKREINELHVPVNRTVVLNMTSQDVIHSFFVPAFRMKQDVVPGRYTNEWFKATKTGEYHLFCAEYCGTEHSRMIGRVVVMEPNEYEQWLRSGETIEPIALAGERLFRERGCSGCHTPGSRIRAPVLNGLYGKTVPLNDGKMIVADDRYLRDAILQPGREISAGYDNIMPSYAGQISEEELMQIIAYLKSVGNTVPALESDQAREREAR
jgi:cytochrome c oxidase subunit II